LSTETCMRKGVQKIVDYGETVVGFDVEYAPQNNTPAWVQIATATKTSLCRICKLRKKPLNPLLPLLTNANILKVGVGIDQDVKHLQGLQHFEAAGFVDINTVARTNGNTLSLQDLSAKFLPGYIAKKKDSSDWVAEDLTDSQINYAATDAWAGREIYVRAEMEAILGDLVNALRRDYCRPSYEAETDLGRLAKDSETKNLSSEALSPPESAATFGHSVGQQLLLASEQASDLAKMFGLQRLERWNLGGSKS